MSVKIGDILRIAITKGQAFDEWRHPYCENRFDCPACGKTGIRAFQQWDLTQSSVMQCGNCKSVFVFVDDYRYPVANVRVQNLGPTVPK